MSKDINRAIKNLLEEINRLTAAGVDIRPIYLAIRTIQNSAERMIEELRGPAELATIQRAAFDLSLNLIFEGRMSE